MPSIEVTKNMDEGSISSFGGEPSDTSTTSSQEADSNNGEDFEIAAKETKWVERSKIMVFIVLIAATASSAYVTYTYTSNIEQQDFHNNFEDYGVEILRSSQIKAATVFETLISQSTAITSFTMATNATWPFVNIPNLAARFSHLLALSGSTYIAISPLVTQDQRIEWERFAQNNHEWLIEEVDGTIPRGVELPPIFPTIFTFGDSPPESPIPEVETRIPQPFYGPFWQHSPPVPYIVNRNIFELPGFDQIFDALNKTRKIVLSPPIPDSIEIPARVEIFDGPTSFIVAPLQQSLKADSPIVAIFSAVLPWNQYFGNAVPDGLGDIFVVVKSTCGPELTFRVDGSNVTYIGPADLHDKQYTHMEVQASFDAIESLDSVGSCQYLASAFPSEEFESTFKTNNPVIFTVAVVAIFVVTSAVFIVYDWFVKRKDTKVMTTATNSNAILTSLFPKQVWERIIEDAAWRRKNRERTQATGSDAPTDEKAILLQTKPIADLFPSATVMFADIAGFTAWASVREPSQVFTLLEQLYGSFDTLAKRRGVFKVETIGDSYVAASGLPEQREDHAVVMTRFARDCLNDMTRVVNELEVLLGPGTAELAMRFGLHSGPVTAGVLRGEKSRFQLFGDTVNTAARLESTGTMNRIHISQETANQLIQQGKGHWLAPRDERVFLKGRGDMQTYWINFMKQGSSRSVAQDLALDTIDPAEGSAAFRTSSSSAKEERLISWNVQVLTGLLKKMVAIRDVRSAINVSKGLTSIYTERPALHVKRAEGKTVLDEVCEIITLPGRSAYYKQDPEKVQLSEEVTRQLHDYVTHIASMYRDNPFHSFEHASHVTQSVTKLLARVVTPDSIDYKEMEYVKVKSSKLHAYTYGITSDPLTQFACAFSAMIHDVDHTGVPNVTLIKENADIAHKYRNKSVAEQNSVDLAWSLLEEDRFVDLRNAIYTTEAELQRFRQLVVNCVMATDIVDTELKALRNLRWDKAFNMLDNSSSHTSYSNFAVFGSKDDVNRKATIVIEHLIQASDVSHTMQHWHVYLKWNEHLFQEMYKAYLAGRIEKDPSENWYKGELGFFDFYLIPLGKKLQECGVFGVSSDEYLNYAQANRKEWELKGRDMVAGYVAKYKSKLQRDNSESFGEA